MNVSALPLHPEPGPLFDAATGAIARLREELGKHLHGKTHVTEKLLAALLARGHVLLEDVPGVGKTTIAHCFAGTLGVSFNRIQFTSDTLPSDVIGVSVFQSVEGSFRFLAGPVFSHVVLADEINRSPARTQSALLEAMERAFVSVDRTQHRLPAPFIVIATQNPVDFDSTYPLPTAQLDRFALRLTVGYPSQEAEVALLDRGDTHYDTLPVRAVVTPEEVLDAQQVVRRIHVDPSLIGYLQAVAAATRQRADLAYGISSRGLLIWKSLSQASALLAGRRYVIPQDIADHAVECLAHRIRLRGEDLSQSSWQASAGVIREVMAKVPPPHVREGRSFA